MTGSGNPVQKTWQAICLALTLLYARLTWLALSCRVCILVVACSRLAVSCSPAIFSLTSSSRRSSRARLSASAWSGRVVSQKQLSKWIFKTYQLLINICNKFYFLHGTKFGNKACLVSSLTCEERSAVAASSSWTRCSAERADSSSCRAFSRSRSIWTKEEWQSWIKYRLKFKVKIK